MDVQIAIAIVLRELKQRRRPWQRERHLKMYLRFSAKISHLFELIILAKCVVCILELYWNHRFRAKKRKLNICNHMLTSSTQLQNRSFHVMERMRTPTKCTKMKNARAKRAKVLFFSLSNMQICGALVVVALFACLRASFAKTLKLLPLISARPKCHTFVHPVP